MKNSFIKSNFLNFGSRYRKGRDNFEDFIKKILRFLGNWLNYLGLLFLLDN